MMCLLLRIPIICAISASLNINIFAMSTVCCLVQSVEGHSFDSHFKAPLNHEVVEILLQYSPVTFPFRMVSNQEMRYRFLNVAVDMPVGRSKDSAAQRQ